MSTHDPMTDRSAHDPVLRHQDELPANGGSSLKVLLAIGVIAAILGVALWFGGPTETGTTPEAPAAMVPADPAMTPEASAPADPATPATDTSTPPADPAQPAPADAAPVNPAPNDSGSAPVTTQ